MNPELPLHLQPLPAHRILVPGAWQASRRSAELRRARALLAEVLEMTGESGQWRLASAHWTSTGAASLRLAGQGAEANRIVTLVPTGQARLARETWVLAHLPATARAPVRLETGEVGGVAFALDELLPGRPGPDLVLAAEAIVELHTQTARERPVDEDVVARWISTPLSVLEQLLARGPLPVPHAKLRRLAEQLHDDLLGMTVSTSWIHGDFWSGNVLTVGSEVTGVIDWDLAADDELPSHDLLNLLIHARARATGRQLGDLVLSLLRAPDWSEAERAILGPSPVKERTALLLYWLRHVAAVGVQQLSYAEHSVVVWRLLNVHRFLRRI